MSRLRERFVAVIPAFNEAATIADIVARTLEQVSEVIVIDDGSIDGTAEAVRGLPVTVLQHESNQGKAASLWDGMERAVAMGATAVITLDGDGQHEPESIPALTALHRRAPDAVIIGSRLHDARLIPRSRYLANRIANFWISWGAGQCIADSQSGFRLYPARVVTSVSAACDRTKGFVFESEVLIEAGRQGVPIRSVPISAVYGRHLRRSHFRSGRDIAGITRMVARKLVARRMDLPALLRSRRREFGPSPLPAALSSPSGGKPGRERCRILFVAEAVSLAHVARAAALIHTLDPDRYEIHLACDPRYDSLFEKLPCARHPLSSISSALFQERLRKGGPLYTVAELREYVKDDLRTLASVAPSLVVGDFRLSLSVSARAAGVPYLAVTNAHWSPQARPRFIVPELVLTERFGYRLGQLLFSLIRPAVFAQQAWALNAVRREYGLPTIPYSLRHLLTEGDYTLYADLPELVPTGPLPPHHHYIGPVTWSPDAEPPWWNQVPADAPLVYVSLGSTGKSELLPIVLQALEGLGVNVLVSTAGRRPPRIAAERIWMAEYVPGLKASARAALVICNGGSATVYQALTAGAPVLGVPGNLDQFLMMHFVQRGGAGEFIRAGEATIDAVARAASRMLRQERYRARAAALQAAIARADGTISFPTMVESLIEGSIVGRRPDSAPTVQDLVYAVPQVAGRPGSHDRGMDDLAACAKGQAGMSERR